MDMYLCQVTNKSFRKTFVHASSIPCNFIGNRTFWDVELLNFYNEYVSNIIAIEFPVNIKWKDHHWLC